MASALELGAAPSLLCLLSEENHVVDCFRFRDKIAASGVVAEQNMGRD